LPPTIDNGGKPQINGKTLRQTSVHREKPVCTSLPAFPVGEHKGGTKLAICSHGRRWSNCFPQGADPIQLKSGMNITDINQKVEPHTRYQINLRSGATGNKIFTSIEQKS
jgi:hypothetical protein